MKLGRTTLSLFLILFCFSFKNQAVDLPRVFKLGEYEKLYEQTIMTHQTQLLTACDNNMKQAYEKWLSMLVEMEAHAHSVKFDLKGTKLWLHVFWKPNGTISHFGFHLKPKSKNISYDELSTFFADFLAQYQFPLSCKTNFSHYGSAAFPLNSKYIDK